MFSLFFSKIKLYDEATFVKANKSGLGVVVRNNHGLVIASLAQQLPSTYQAVEIETLAATRALEFALEIGVDRDIVKCDSETVVKALVT
nr:hypothetical protein CFP56_46591 [Quercus suber]